VKVKISKAGIDATEQDVTVYKPETVATPVANPTGHTFTNSTTVVLSTATLDAVIYYTLDGSTPEQVETSDNFKYTDSITIETDLILKARAFKEGLTPSGVVTESYTKERTVLETAATPTSSPEGPHTFYTATLTVSLATVTEGATIHYTTDGTEPTGDSMAYTSPFAIGESAAYDAQITVKAIAVKDFMNNSGVLTVEYTKGNPTLQKAAKPTANHTTDGIVSGTSITLSSTTAGATIYYTLDGVNPSTASSASLANGGSLTISFTDTNRITLKAMAVKSPDLSDSDILEINYRRKISDGSLSFVDISAPEGVLAVVNGVAWNGSRYVAVDIDGKIAYSDDEGRTWTPVTGSPFGNIGITGIAWGAGKFVAVSHNTTYPAAYSSNGETWTPVSIAGVKSYSGGQLTTVVYGGPLGQELFVAGSDGGQIVWSTDGITWTLIEGGNSSDGNMGDSGMYYKRVNKIIWGAGNFVAAGFEQDGERSEYYGVMAFSPNGKTWTNIPGEIHGVDFSIEGIAYGDGKYVATSVSMYDATNVASINAADLSASNQWTALHTGTETSPYYYYTTYNQGKFLGKNSDEGEKVSYASNAGVTWTDLNMGSIFPAYSLYPGSPMYSSIASISCVNGKFFIGGNNGRMAIQE
jgi:hypothetical protein